MEGLGNIDAYVVGICETCTYLFDECIHQNVEMA